MTSSGATTRPAGNTTHQNDTVYAGAGNDWVYASHGYNNIHGGGGHDTIRVWFGHGFVDCGPGKRDILYVSKTQDKKVKRKNCEKVSHKSARNGGPRPRQLEVPLTGERVLLCDGRGDRL